MPTEDAVRASASGAIAAPLEAYRVVDLSVGIAGAYCSKVLADGGAEVIKLEPPGGDPLRSRRLSGPVSDIRRGGALFQYLAASKSSVVIRPDEDADMALAQRLVADADVVVWSAGSELTDGPFGIDTVRELAPDAVIAALSAFGLTGPWADRPWTAATLDAMSGAAGQRGRPDLPPVLAGNEPAEWLAGMFAGVGVLTSLCRAGSDLLDVSMLEASILAGSAMYPVTFDSIAGRPWRPVRAQNLPDVHPTKDGYVGFMIVTGQQWTDFCAMIGRDDWIEDESLFFFHNRNTRRAELVAAINEWTSDRTTAEVTDLAAMLRVPAAPLGTGAAVPALDQVAERHFVVPEPRGTFLQPNVPYARIDGQQAWTSIRPSPDLGADTERLRAEPPGRVRPAAPFADGPALPLAGMRVADFTAFWAGPIIGNLLGAMGADVIHIESAKHPDGQRFGPLRSPGEPEWWEWSPLFHGPNTNKRAISLDLATPRGVELARDLLRECDVLVENFSPRVLENWGLDYKSVREIRPDIVMVRAPAYGVTGPWRNWGGYAQTIEDASGMSYLTGYPDEEPQVLNGICDPAGGTHATIALLLGVLWRQRTGQGVGLESTMLAAGLNIAAEPLLEHSAYGTLLERNGNQGLLGAPQGVFLTADERGGERDTWVTVSVTTDEHWAGLCAVLEHPDLLRDERFSTIAARRTNHKPLTEVLAAWCAERLAVDVVDSMTAAGVPACEVTLPHEQPMLEQLRRRGFFEEVEHPVVGTVVHSSYPFRSEKAPGPFNRSHAPLFGQHNAAVLTGVLGLSDREVDELTESGVISASPYDPGVSWGV